MAYWGRRGCRPQILTRRPQQATLQPPPGHQGKPRALPRQITGLGNQNRPRGLHVRTTTLVSWDKTFLNGCVQFSGFYVIQDKFGISCHKINKQMEARLNEFADDGQKLFIRKLDVAIFTNKRSLIRVSPFVSI